jgi:hypothetical protein
MGVDSGRHWDLELFIGWPISSRETLNLKLEGVLLEGIGLFKFFYLTFSLQQVRDHPFQLFDLS